MFGGDSLEQSSKGEPQPTTHTLAFGGHEKANHVTSQTKASSMSSSHTAVVCLNSILALGALPKETHIVVINQGPTCAGSYF